MVSRPGRTHAGAMTTSDLPPQGEPQPAPGATTTDDGPRVTRDDLTDLGRLRRSRTDRHIAGVAGGVARHLDIDPVIVRVVFVITAFFGGAGLFVYGALWLLVPEEGEAHAPINLEERARGVALVVVGVLAALALLGDSWGGGNWFPWPLVLIGLVVWLLLNRRRDRRERRYAEYGTSQTGWVQPPAPGDASGPAAPTYAAPHQPAYVYTPPPRPRDPRKRGPVLFWLTLALIALATGALGIAELSGADVASSAYPALAVAITGVMLVVGAVWGRAGGLTALGLLLTIPLVVTTVVDNVDNRTVTHDPDSASQVRDRYWNAAGDMVVDLSDVTDVDSLDGRTIAVEGGVGRIEVIVPPGALVNASADVDGPGSVEVFGEEHGGIDIAVTGSRSAVAAGGSTTDQPTIEIDAKLGVGEIVITQ